MPLGNKEREYPMYFSKVRTTQKKITLVSCAFFPFLSVTLITRTMFPFFSLCLLRSYPAHCFLSSLFVFVSISRTVFFLFCLFVRSYLAHCFFSFLFVCYVRISRTVSFLFCLFVTFVSRAPFLFFSVCLLRLCLAHCFLFFSVCLLRLCLAHCFVSSICLLR